MKKIILLICGGLLSASAAFGVSRVGTGTLSNDEIGFMTSVPQIFDQSFVFSQGDVRFDGPVVIRNGKSMTGEKIFFLVYLLQNKQPEWIGDHDRAKFQAHYLNLGWERIEHADPCVEQYRTESSTNINWILSWGGGRGVIITGPKIPMVVSGLEKMATDLKLISGACAWN